jgi:hypothetical protein
LELDYCFFGAGIRARGNAALSVHSEFKQAMGVFQQVYRVEAKVTSERKITARLSAATGSWLLLCAMS